MNARLAPLKRFGQNFLTDKNIVRKIVRCAGLTASDIVLEIGPGRGALTFEMAKIVKSLIAVELDRGQCLKLIEETKGLNNVDIVCGDILKFNLKSYLKKAKIRSVKVVANVPYYITTPIIEFLFKNIGCVDDIFLTVQREFADRITADPGTSAYGSLTCFVNYHCASERLFNIKSASFWPRPKVESSFLRLRPLKKSEQRVKARSKSLFFKVVRSAFGQRRKRLYASLSNVLDKESLKQLPCQDLLDKRAGELSVPDFLRVSNLIFDFSKKR